MRPKTLPCRLGELFIFLTLVIMAKAPTLSWDKLAESYPEEVYSLTATPQKRSHIVNQIRDAQRVLIVGCGSETHLQKHIVETYPEVMIYACDFSSGMLEVAQRTYSDPRLLYQREDTTCLSFPDGSFDVVVSTNSIIPERREEVHQMYAEISRVLKQDGSFLAFLPSFECAQEIAATMVRQLGLNDLSVLSEKIDKSQARVNETSGWQCFHTQALIRAELAQAGFLSIEIEKIGVESEEEYQQLARTYHSTLIADHLWEFFIKARKQRKCEVAKPRSVEILAGGYLRLETYTSGEITPELLQEIADYYRYIFNNENGHYLVYPSTGEFVSPQALFGSEDVSLELLDQFTDYPYHPSTHEQAQVFHDPHKTYQKIKEMLGSNASIILLREQNSEKVVGMTFEYEASLETIWKSEWKNKYSYMKTQEPAYDRSFEEFMSALKKAFAQEDYTATIDEQASFLCWNCTAITKKHRNTDNFLKMIQRLHTLALEQNPGHPRFTLFESMLNGTAYTLLSAGGAFDIPGVLEKPTMLMACDVVQMKNNVSLPYREVRRLIATYLKKKDIKS